MKLSENHQLENSDVVLTGVHNSEDCLGEFCTMHKRSNHPMRSFPQHWRSDRAIMERICPHGVGHPDPDDIKISMFDHSSGKTNYELVHGCDGCCAGSYK
jgi:hypothetical protein